MFNQGLDITFAAVIFSDDVTGCVGTPQSDCWVPFVADSTFSQVGAPAIAQMVEANNPMGGTRTSLGLNKAYDLMNIDSVRSAPNKWLVLVSDGQPTPAGEEPLAVAAAQRFYHDPLNAEVVTLHIDIENDTAAQQFMQQISGKGESPQGNPKDYYYAQDATQLAQALLKILGRIYCPVTLSGPVRFDSSTPVFGAFLRSGPGGSEQKLRFYDGTTPADQVTDLEFMYDEPHNEFTLLPKACKLAATQNLQVVLRYNRARLVE
jgi:hypothetical protein